MTCFSTSIACSVKRALTVAVIGLVAYVALAVAVTGTVLQLAEED